MAFLYPWRHAVRFSIPGIIFALLTLVAPLNPSYGQSPAEEPNGYSSESVFVALLSDGDAMVEYDIGIVDPLADQIKVRLFAENSIRNLVVVDYEDNIIEYDTGDNPNEITLRTPGVTNARISYMTQDLVSKIQTRWTFSLNSSSTSVVVKLPSDSVLIDPGQNFPTITQVGEQQLLTFKPGNVTFVYVIGVLGTEEQANIVIRLAQNTIKQITDQYPGIVLTSADSLLQAAVKARDDGRFPDAERIAGDANDEAIATGRNYEGARQAIDNAGNQIRDAQSQGRDTVAATQTLDRASMEFVQGNYEAARISAGDAVSAIGNRPAEPQMPLFVIVTATIAAAGGIGAMIFLRMKKPRPIVYQKRKAVEDGSRGQVEKNLAANDKSPVHESPAARLQPQVQDPRATEDLTPPVELEYDADRSSLSAPASSMIPESQIDRSVLSRIVTKIVEEKPHLRPEDQDVLKFLAEKEGAAFESEIRTKFQLPKTTIWRLVKRLEREELVEIRKAGGQNLIKLRFEDMQ